MRTVPTRSDNASAAPTRGRKRSARATPVMDALASHDAYAALRENIGRIRALETVLLEALPAYLRGNVAVTSAREGVLTLLTPHGALAARLRHLEPQAVAALQKGGWNVDRIKVRIQPAAPAPPAPAKAAHLSAKGVSCLAELEAGMPPSPLRDALSRMLSRHR